MMHAVLVQFLVVADRSPEESSFHPLSERHSGVLFQCWHETLQPTVESPLVLLPIFPVSFIILEICIVLLHYNQLEWEFAWAPGDSKLRRCKCVTLCRCKDAWNTGP